MTDTEIIKAFECCVFKTIDKCDKCILARYGNDCRKLGGYVLDLINRQKAEIKSLEEMLDSAVSSEANTIDTTNYMIAEAVKDFADRLKKRAMKNDFICMGEVRATEYIISNHELDNLLKERVGDGDGLF